MANCNWRTKLKTNKIFIKGIRTKISNQKNKNWNWKTKNKMDNGVCFQVGERKERKKKGMTIGNKSFIICHHAPYQEEEDTMVLPQT